MEGCMRTFQGVYCGLRYEILFFPRAQSGPEWNAVYDAGIVIMTTGVISQCITACMWNVEKELTNKKQLRFGY